ncbi:hypothetical protein H5410_007699 [Solanum commersonii]|uniref:Uncharacterized protein n=1 Tax=Solanum commersonii TaxID=4109 RepID=A0A9J6ADG9_SOLCO|nr:hypothetical protein H5410_007699 [Solanum commersonii]
MSSPVELLNPQHSFEVKFVQDIMQQESDMTAKWFFAVFVEFLSNEINIPSNDFRSDYLHTRYAIRENDDPTRQIVTTLHQQKIDDLVNVE